MWCSGKESAYNAEDARETGSIPESGISPGGRNGNPLQYSCLKNPMERGAWWTTAQRVTESDTTDWLSSTGQRQRKCRSWTTGVLRSRADLNAASLAAQLAGSRNNHHRHWRLITIPLLPSREQLHALTRCSFWIEVCVFAHCTSPNIFLCGAMLTVLFFHTAWLQNKEIHFMEREETQWCHSQILYCFYHSRWKWKWKFLSGVWLLVTPWII